ncbi:hypothetical protein [Ekhidna sp.]|uniref:hypothetical protein n=1 Tax=Ekhidna sp. TaxID=2608089 RepID=UPI003297E82F
MNKRKLFFILILLISGYVKGQIKYPQIRSYISSSITSDEKNYDYILYRILGEEVRMDTQGYLLGRSKIFQIADSLISPKLAVSRIKEIPKEHKGSKYKLINKKYYGGNNPVPQLEIYKSDTVKLRYWVEVYYQKIMKDN